MKKREGDIKKYEGNVGKYEENMHKNEGIREYNYAPLYMGSVTSKNSGPSSGGRGSRILDLVIPQGKDMKNVNMWEI